MKYFFKKILFVFLTTLITGLISCIFSFILNSFFSNGKLEWNSQLLSTQGFKIIAIILFLIFTFSWVYISSKYKFFSSSKLIRKNDRTTSKLYDNQEFMSEKEIYQKFGDYDFTKLSTLDDVYGYVVNSHYSKNKLKVSLVKDKHAMLIGTNGTGKSLYEAGMTIQVNAVSKAKPSMIINDLAGELYEQHSAQLKQSGYKISVINLREPRKSLNRYNPLSYIWDLFYEYQNDKTRTDIIDRVAVNISELALVVCPDNSNEKNWSQGARGIFVGCIWGMLEDSLIPEFHFTKDMFTITQVSNIINRQKERLLAFLFHRPITSKVFDSASLIKDNRSEKTVDSYLSHLTTALTLFLETGMQYLTSASDIDLKTITQEPTAIFIIVPVEYPSRQVVGCMLYTQIFNHLAYEASLHKGSRLDRTIYFILDEFGNLPKLPSFPNWITTSRKMRIFFFIMLQSIQQLDIIYGKEQSVNIRNNCHLQMYLGASDEDTIKFFKEKFGTYTAISRSQNFDTQNLSITEFKGNTSLAKADLTTQSDLQQIKAGEMYSFVIREKPLFTHLLPIFAEEIKNIILIEQQEVEPPAHQYENKIYDLKRRAKLMGEEDEEAPANPNPTNNGGNSETKDTSQAVDTPAPIKKKIEKPKTTKSKTTKPKVDIVNFIKN